MHNQTKKEIIKLIWIFVIGSFIGFLIETILVICRGNFEVRKGLIYGPFIPVYGIGAVIYYLILSNIKLKNDNRIKNVLIVFILTMLVGGFIEYLCSYLQEICFGTVSWDYSNLKINFDGRVSLRYSIYWGLLGVVYYLVLIPLIDKSNNLLDKTIVKITTVVITVFMILDISISALACYRQNERRNNIGVNSKLDIFLDNYYTDEYLDKIFVNAIKK